MNNRNQRVVQQLGMPIGTASNRLRRKIIFAMLTGAFQFDNKCFKCGELIESEDDLSVEHKEPWENQRNAEQLYWDIENISFSHLRCNIPHAYHGATRKRVDIDGRVKCSSCQQNKSTEEFSKSRTAWNGLNFECRSCQKIYKDKVRYGLVS